MDKGPALILTFGLVLAAAIVAGGQLFIAQQADKRGAELQQRLDAQEAILKQIKKQLEPSEKTPFPTGRWRLVGEDNPKDPNRTAFLENLETGELYTYNRPSDSVKKVVEAAKKDK